MDALRSAGVDTPAPMGQDEEGRQIQEFVPGQLALNAAPLSHAELRRVGAMIRVIHDASATYSAIFRTRLHRGLRILNIGGGDVDTATPMGSMLFTMMALWRRWSTTSRANGSSTLRGCEPRHRFNLT